MEFSVIVGRMVVFDGWIVYTVVAGKVGITGRGISVCDNSSVVGEQALAIRINVIRAVNLLWFFISPIHPENTTR